MRFEEVLPALREGKKARRPEWVSNGYIEILGSKFIDHRGNPFSTWMEWASQFLENDWEIIKELKKYKIKKWFNVYENSPGEAFLGVEHKTKKGAKSSQDEKSNLLACICFEKEFKEGEGL